MLININNIILLCITTLFHTGTCLNLDIVRALDSHYNLNRLSIICPTTELRKSFFSGDAMLGALKVISELKEDAEVTELEVGSAVVCADAVSIDSISSLFNRSVKLGGRKPWVFLHDNMTSLELLQDRLTLRIDQRVYFCDLETGFVYESYSVGDYPIFREISQLVVDPVSGYRVVPSWEMNNFLQRRSNFMGASFRVLVDQQVPYIGLSSMSTDEVTTPSGDTLIRLDGASVTGIFNDMLFIMMSELNFTTELFRRKDQVWGTVDPVTNKSSGMISSLEKGEADMIAASLTVNPDRAKVVNYLIPIGTETYAVFIKTTGTEEFAWKVFIDPFNRDLWVFLALNALGCTIIIKLFELMLSKQSRRLPILKQFEDMLFYKWMFLCSYFGKGPPKIPSDNKTPFRIILFAMFLIANVIWMSYRASLTSELSNVVQKKPFNNLEELLESDFHLVVRSGGLSSSHFLQAKDDTIYKKLYNKYFHNQDSRKYLFPSVSEGMEHLMKAKKIAFYNILESIVTLSEYRCQVSIPWMSHFPSFLAMAVKKGNPFFQFLNYHTLLHSEKGTVRILSSRWKKEIADCTELNAKPLGKEKLVSLFTFLAMGSILAVVSFVGEKIIGCIRVREDKQLSAFEKKSAFIPTERRRMNRFQSLDLNRRVASVLKRAQFSSHDYFPDKEGFIQELEELLLALKQANNKF